MICHSRQLSFCLKINKSFQSWKDAIAKVQNLVGAFVLAGGKWTFSFFHSKVFFCLFVKISKVALLLYCFEIVNTQLHRWAPEQERNRWKSSFFATASNIPLFRIDLTRMINQKINWEGLFLTPTWAVLLAPFSLILSVGGFYRGLLGRWTVFKKSPTFPSALWFQYKIKLWLQYKIKLWPQYKI